MTDEILASEASSAQYNGFYPNPRFLAAPKPFEINEALAEGYASLQKNGFRTHDTLDDVIWSVTNTSPGDSLDALLSMPTPGTFRYTLSSAAHADLCAIWEVAKSRETSAAAKRLIRELVRDIGTFVQTPAFGRVRPELLGTPHCFPNRWTIYYHPTARPDGIAIVRVLDGRSIQEDQPTPGKISRAGVFRIRHREDAPPQGKPADPAVRILGSYLIIGGHSA